MGSGHRVVVSVSVPAPPARLWRALTVPGEVAAWDGVGIVAVPDGYPAPGQHARWRTRIGPWGVTLHDRVQVVEEQRRLASVIDVAFVHVEEEYQLVATGDATVVVSGNLVSSTVPGLGPLARHLTRRAVSRSMRRLAAHCGAGDEAG